MQVPDLKLAEISFSAAPTRSQLVNMLRDIHKFLGNVGAALIMDGSYTIADQPLGAMLNASIQLKAASDQFDAGPSAQGLSEPRMAPGVPRVAPR
jgi:hypothetical protein